MIKSDYARVNARPVQVTRWRANVEHVTHNDDGSDSVEYVECWHEHDSAGAAEKCARKMASVRTKEVIGR